MKKIIVLLIIAFSYIPAQSQDADQGKWERIKALKVAFFTQELNLSEKVAEKFWPIYNKYEKDRRSLQKREHVDLNNVECMTEAEANNLLKEFLSVENEEFVIKQKLFQDLKKIISAKDIIKLHKLEDEFHKKLIKEYRSRKEQENANSSE